MMNANRWNKISEKYSLNSQSTTSKEVKKFLEMNFTEELNDELCGKSIKKVIDPALIMDLRHKEVSLHTK